MKKILFITTQYRVGERIYSIIPQLSKQYDLDVLKTAQMSDNMKWYGDKDLRTVFDNKYKKYIESREKMKKVGEHVTIDFLGVKKDYTPDFYNKVIYKIA